MDLTQRTPTYGAIVVPDGPFGPGLVISKRKPYGATEISEELTRHLLRVHALFLNEPEPIDMPNRPSAVIHVVNAFEVSFFRKEIEDDPGATLKWALNKERQLRWRIAQEQAQ